MKLADVPGNTDRNGEWISHSQDIAGRKIPVAIFLSASICSRPEYPWFVSSGTWKVVQCRVYYLNMPWYSVFNLMCPDHFRKGSGHMTSSLVTSKSGGSGNYNETSFQPFPSGYKITSTVLLTSKKIVIWNKFPGLHSYLPPVAKLMQIRLVPRYVNIIFWTTDPSGRAARKVWGPE